MKLHLWTPSFEGIPGGIQRHSAHLEKMLSQCPEVNHLTTLTYGASKNPVSKFFQRARFVTTVLLYLIFRRPDFVWCTHVDLARVASCLQRFGAPPFLISCHGIEVWSPQPAEKLKTLRRAHRLICVSEFTRPSLLTALPLQPGQVITLPNSIDPPPIEDSRDTSRRWLQEQHRIPQDHHIIFSLARMHPADREKGYGKTLEAVARLNRDGHPCTYIAGGGGEDGAWLQERASVYGCTDKLVCPGLLPEDLLPRYYQGSDIFALPSKKEGFGLVFLESLFCGTPVLAGNRDASPEPLLGGELGLLCNPDSVSELYCALKSFIETRDHPLKNASRLMQRVNQEFGPVQYQQRLQNILKDILTP